LSLLQEMKLQPGDFEQPHTNDRPLNDRRDRLDAPRMAAYAAIIAAGVALVVVSVTGAPSVGASILNNLPLTNVQHSEIIERSAVDVAKATSPDVVRQAVAKDTSVQLAALTPEKATPATAAPKKTAVVEAKPDINTVRVRKGDTLMKALVRAGAPRKQAYNAIAALGKNFNPRRLKIGQELQVAFAPKAIKSKSATELLYVQIAVDVDRDVITEREDKGFVSREVLRELNKVHMRSVGTINDSLYLSARRSGMPIAILMEMIRIFSWDVDFQRDIQRGDSFELFYEQFTDDSGKALKFGDVLYANMMLSGTKVSLYRHKLADGAVDYFNEKGQSARKALLRTPVNGARLSSRYGKRRHPVLGYTKMHRGLDFAAPRGTPIMAGGDGVVEMAQRNGSYGNYVRIRHNNNYKTAYGHMKNFGRSIRRGKRVRQGQIIGYIGTTGRSTGPHLHYEILKAGRQINPLRLKLPTGRKLKGKALARFQDVRSSTDQALAATLTASEVASNAN
jgi:murein DD-endopeptidase MepM/ murein hydrolase activator NlpD